ncbi:MAG TPA: hypothetical protein VFN56_04745 [Candidatus Saccharimonadales bacterium]|nr:hypothetical protein [Candidatus Saccharimonadales bacterium]
MKLVARVLQSSAALVVGTSSLLMVGLTGVANAAAPYTCSWTGAAGDGKFSTAANWSDTTDSVTSGCGVTGAAPLAADNDGLIFDNTSLTSNATLTNDITGLAVGTFIFQGTGTYGFTITGNAITLSSGVLANDNGNGINTIDTDISLSSNATISESQSSAGLVLGDYSTAHTLNLSGHSLTFSGPIQALQCGKGGGANKIYDSLSGGGTFIDNVAAPVVLHSDSPNFSGAFEVLAGTLDAASTNALGASSGITSVASGANFAVSMSQNTTYNVPLTLSGGTLIADSNATLPDACLGGGSSQSYTATFSAPVTLTANSTYYGGRYTGTTTNTTISGTYTNNGFTFTGATGSQGTLSLPGGQQVVASVQTTNYTANSPTTPLTISQNQTAIVDGTYGQTVVEGGGTLKGNGTVGALFVYKDGIVAPGHSPGCLTINGDYTQYGTYQAEIGGTTACTGYDQLIVNGNVTLSDGQTPPMLGTLQLSLVNNFKPQVGQTFEIINNKGSKPVTDTFSGLAEGATINVNGNVFKISYKGGDGNDVVLTVITAASPNTGFALVSTRVAPVLGVCVGASALLIVAGRRYNGAKK